MHTHGKALICRPLHIPKHSKAGVGRVVLQWSDSFDQKEDDRWEVRTVKMNSGFYIMDVDAVI